MANSPSSRKRASQNIHRRLRNMTLRSSGRTAIKRVEKAIAERNFETATLEFNKVQSILDSLDRKGIFSSNKVARHKSRINQRIKALKPA